MQQELSDLVALLKPAAVSASKRAHAPYSGLQIGACVLTQNGELHSGSNIENASYGLTICAERVAASTAVAASEEPRGELLSTCLIYSSGPRPLTPCGACRQFLSEFMSADGLVLSCCDTQAVACWRLDQLLPDQFSLPLTER
jgi:cytidine deaminase